MSERMQMNRRPTDDITQTNSRPIPQGSNFGPDEDDYHPAPPVPDSLQELRNKGMASQTPRNSTSNASEIPQSVVQAGRTT